MGVLLSGDGAGSGRGWVRGGGEEGAGGVRAAASVLQEGEEGEEEGAGTVGIREAGAVDAEGVHGEGVAVGPEEGIRGAVPGEGSPLGDREVAHEVLGDGNADERRRTQMNADGYGGM
ncbi:MAG TPA: hypothetical protein VMW50_06940 [Dehalococcoidia bacterium]|nr:hypothetical protein [Dehalococcoidia bacterium]